MRATRRSDEDRFKELYAETRHDLLAFVMRRASSPEDAADVLAETYLIAWRALHHMPRDERARLWLFGVARNLLLKTARQARVRNALSERLAAELRATTDDVGTIHDAPMPELGAALAELPAQDREILRLSAWEGLSPREIAKVIDRRPNTVRVRLHRARKRLRHQLDRERRPPSSLPHLQPTPDQ